MIKLFKSGNIIPTLNIFIKRQSSTGPRLACYL